MAATGLLAPMPGAWPLAAPVSPAGSGSAASASPRGPLGLALAPDTDGLCPSLPHAAAAAAAVHQQLADLQIAAAAAIAAGGGGLGPGTSTDDAPRKLAILGLPWETT